MTREEAERMLTEWVTVTRDRNTQVRAAVAAGVSKYRVNQITGIGRSTIDRILAASPAGGAKATLITPGCSHAVSHAAGFMQVGVM